MTVMTDLTIILNGEPRRIAAGTTIAVLLADLDLPAAKVAVERNLEIVPRSTFADVRLAEG
ncbi:MAG: sulfur carrier protein ThiS, partial [Sandarakinorhabdus sp.]|nr:sulfur carrier protein ThiS [Sandarakinorhabdus sp.]